MTKPSNTFLFVCVAAIFFIACRTVKSNPVAGEWRLVEYSNAYASSLIPACVAPNSNYILTLNENGTFIFSTDCNTVSGYYSVDGGSINFTDLSWTELALAEGEPSVELSVKLFLPNVNSFSLDGDNTLQLRDNPNTILFSLKREQNE